MRFVDDGPDIPAELIAAQESGEVVFLYGAGASMTAGLPSFRELAEGTYSALEESWSGYPAESAVIDLADDCERPVSPNDAVSLRCASAPHSFHQAVCERARL